MKRLIERLFKKEPEFSYTIADYLPVKTNRLRTDVQVTEYAATEYQIEQASKHDEMEIDEIYRNS